METENRHFRQLTATWLALVALTFAGLGLGEWMRDTAWLSLPVAGLIWLKGTLVARSFIETRIAHPFITRLLRAFIALAPLALVLTAFFGATLARWATL
jgi:hypothetical protein